VANGGGRGGNAAETASQEIVPPKGGGGEQAALPNFGGGNGGGGGGGKAPGLAVVPAFMGAGAETGDMAKHYVKQVCGERVPTVADWQKLAAMKLPDADKWLHAPVGQGHFVMAMCLDKQNNLWVGTEGEGLYRWSAVDGMWTQYVATRNVPPDGSPAIPASAIECGMGDNYVYALACDSEGRIWAGHLNHGVSVFNGEKWQTFEVVGGLSRPDTLNGPLGERLFHISVCPSTAQGAFKDPLTDKESGIAGSVWMCTSAGLAIYFPSTDTWSYVTRAEGLPSDQANALAFASDGTVYVATQCDGIVIASAKDSYKTWKQVARRLDGSIGRPLDDELPVTEAGSGLPCNLMNDVLVGRDGTVYATTTAGLAWSEDKGETWKFVRGADYVERVKGSLRGEPAGWTPGTDTLLSEDYSTALAEDGVGNIHVGHRSNVEDVLRPRATSRVMQAEWGFVSSLLPLPGNGTAVLGTYGKGLYLDGALAGNGVAGATRPVLAGAKRMPAGHAANDAYVAMVRRQAKTDISAAASGAFVGEDWMTKGDWMGRYGREYAVLCASNSPLDVVIPLGMVGLKFSLKTKIGPHATQGDGKRNWLAGKRTDDPNSPWNPFVGARREGEWDDHGEAYSANWEGPNLNINVLLPEGLYRLSLYFYDGNGYNHAFNEKGRDYHLRVGPAPADGEQFEPTLRLRVQNFHGGVYKQFLFEGSKAYRLEVARGQSLNTILNAVHIDRLAGPQSHFYGAPLGCMGHVRYDPPEVPKAETLSARVADVAARWETLTEVGAMGSNSPHLRADRVLAYRAAAEAGAPPELLSAWRWAVPIWTPADRSEWVEKMKQGRADFLRLNPKARQEYE
jgi:hypothetical protein